MAQNLENFGLLIRKFPSFDCNAFPLLFPKNVHNFVKSLLIDSGIRIHSPQMIRNKSGKISSP